MKDNLDQTVNTYQENFHKYAERTVAEVSGEFKVWEDAGSDRGTDENRLPKKMLTVLRRFVSPVENNLDTVETQQEIYT